MQCFSENFDPNEYDGITDIRGNERVTLMSHRGTNKLIVRKRITGANKELYKQLVHIRHENLVQILGLEETESYCYTYEKYINGKTLAEILADGPVTEEKAFDWIRQVCSAVRVLHEQTPVIIHRDIKPGNVMLTSDGVIKLIDFDAAKGFVRGKSRDTELIGTPEYAAPEQYGFAPSDPRTDIYAVGVLFHELITGYKPNESKAPYNGWYKHVIQNCIELDPERRYRSVAELERKLEILKVTELVERIPGFRTGVWWKKMVASIVYMTSVVVMIASFCAELELSGDMMNSLAFPVFLIIFFVPPCILITNFLGLRDRLPLLRTTLVRKKMWGIAFYLLAWLLLVIVYLTFFAV